MVVAIPEGLPLAVTMSLAYSVKKMLDDQNLVRRLNAIEVMSALNIICSDKTGTLTQNKMSLQMLWNKDYIPIPANKTDLKLSDYVPEKVQQKFLQAIACNSSAGLEPVIGSKTEVALLKFLENCGIKWESMRVKYLPEGFMRFTFTSQRKMMSTQVQMGESQ